MDHADRVDHGGACNIIFTLVPNYRLMFRIMALISFLCVATLGVGTLAGCSPPPVEPSGILLGLNVVSIPLMQRTPFDAAWSIATGRDCSVVRWDRGLGYCRSPEPPPAAPAFCSRSLGGVDCWLDPIALVNRPRELADGPRTLTAAQDAHRTRRWPMF